MPPKPRAPTRKRVARFDLQAFLDSSGADRRIVKYAQSAPIFVQGEPASAVMYIQEGTVKLSVIARSGKEAIVAVLGPGDFLGEGCLAGQSRRMSSASAMSDATLLVVDKPEMLSLLRKHHTLADRFITHMLARNIRIEEDLVDQLFNSSEKRLARTLLLLARYGKDAEPDRVLPKVSQETLAEIVGTTRSRINFFMNKFRKLGFIEYNGGLEVKSSLLSVVLHD